MGNGERMAGKAARRDCQLYLIMEVQAATRDHLSAVLAQAPITSVLFRPGKAAKLTAQLVKPLVDLAQSKDAAALLLDDVALARTLRADGVHLSATADLMARYDDARSVLGAGAIVGADAGGSRHIAMELGEAGAEYVAFGADRSLVAAVGADADADADDETPEDVAGPLTQRELIAWWSDVFEVPCVALDLADASAVREMAAVGADFVAVVCPVATSAGEVVAWVKSIRDGVERVDA
jgi:thiamine-phosphate pyrophosphorylase